MARPEYVRLHVFMCTGSPLAGGRGWCSGHSQQRWGNCALSYHQSDDTAKIWTGWYAQCVLWESLHVGDMDSMCHLFQGQMPCKSLYVREHHNEVRQFVAVLVSPSSCHCFSADSPALVALLCSVNEPRHFKEGTLKSHYTPCPSLPSEPRAVLSFL